MSGKRGNCGLVAYAVTAFVSGLSTVATDPQCSYSANPAALYPRRLTGALKLLPSNCLGVTLTEIDELQRRCLVQRTIDTNAKNCNYSEFSRFLHEPVVNKFYSGAA